MTSRPHRDTIFLEEAEILAHEAFPGEQYTLRIRARECAAHARPGTFVHLPVLTRSVTAGFHPINDNMRRDETTGLLLQFRFRGRACELHALIGHGLVPRIPHVLHCIDGWNTDPELPVAIEVLKPTVMQTSP